jgi:hypothetical protein
MSTARWCASQFQMSLLLLNRLLRPVRRCLSNKPHPRTDFRPWRFRTSWQKGDRNPESLRQLPSDLCDRDPPKPRPAAQTAPSATNLESTTRRPQLLLYEHTENPYDSTVTDHQKSEKDQRRPPVRAVQYRIRERAEPDKLMISDLLYILIISIFALRTLWPPHSSLV